MAMPVNDDTFTKVSAALEELRPFLQDDNGDVDLVDISGDGVVSIAFKGACRACHLQDVTFKSGIEAAIRSAAPEVHSVIAVDL